MTHLFKIMTTHITTTLVLLSSASFAAPGNSFKTQFTAITPGTVSRLSVEKQFKTSDFIGTWQASLFQKSPDGQTSVSATGALTYQPNGKSVGQMKIIVSGIDPSGQAFKLHYKLSSQGTWSIKGNLLTETVTSIQGGLNKMQTGSQITELNKLSSERRNKILVAAPKIKDLIPTNVPDNLTIRAVTPTNIILKNKTGTIITLTRTAHPIATQLPAAPAQPTPAAPAQAAPIKPGTRSPSTPKPTASSPAITPVKATSFYGRWNAKLTKKDPASGNLITLTGAITYKSDNSFSTRIIVNISGMNGNTPFALTYNLWTKGTWGVNNNILTETITDVKSIPVTVKNGERTITVATLPVEQRNKVIANLPNMSAMFPKNTPEASRILKVSANELTISSEGDTYTLKRDGAK